MRMILTMAFLVAFCILVICCDPTHAAGTDQTVEAYSKGTEVVDATIMKIALLDDRSQLLQSDNRFLRRIAWVETEDGTASRTYSDPAYHGGIWRVDESIFDMTVDMARDNQYSDIFQNIQEVFGIYWVQIVWEECNKPFYSALAARLFIHKISPVIQPGVGTQAALWNNNYHQNQSTEDYFIQKVMELENSGGCQAAGLDLVFVMDGSGSVGRDAFQTAKTFVQSTVDFFNISADNTRVGVIQYSSTVTTEFNLNAYTDKESVNNAIGSIVYKGGQTETERALQVMANESFLVENGARPDGIPRVAVVITDGKSQGADLVRVPADKAREMDITIFAIGVTSNVDESELNAIANEPNDTYVFHVSNYNAISNIGAALQDQSCRGSAAFTGIMLNGSLDGNQVQNLKRDIPPEGTTFTIVSTEGDVDMYGSATFPNPNSALNDFHLKAMEGGGPVDIFIGGEFFNSSSGDGNARRRRQVTNQNDTEDEPIGTVYITVEGKQATNVFSLMTAVGDVTEPDPTTDQDSVTSPVIEMTTPEPRNSCSSVKVPWTYIAMMLLNAAFSAGLIIVLYTPNELTYRMRRTKENYFIPGIIFAVCAMIAKVGEWNACYILRPEIANLFYSHVYSSILACINNTRYSALPRP